MESGDGDPSAGDKRSHSSEKNNSSPFVDEWEGYTWNQEAGQWSYDGFIESHPPSCYEAKTPGSPPFDGREPFTDDSGTRYFTPDQCGHMRLHEVQNTKTTRSMSPNPERLEPEPKREHNLWTPAEDQRLVLSIKEGRLTWAQISAQVGSRDEASCKDRWNRIKSEYPDVHHVNSRQVERYSDMDASSSRPKDGAGS